MGGIEKVSLNLPYFLLDTKFKSTKIIYRIKKNEIKLDVYNGSNNNVNNVTVEQMVAMGMCVQ